MSRVAGARRFFLAVAVAHVAAGCGGASSTTTTPPPTNTTPASVVVQAGDGQQAAPGAAVATSPAVLVTNSAGQPVAGVTVTFTVDSGGGSLSTSTATTGANGIATAGTWTLGSSEGRNTLRVTVGSLPPVKIAATAVVAATSYPPVTIGTGGGSITVTQPGPLNGFSITVPAGAFSSGITATVSYASSAGLPRTTIIPVSPLITISTTVTDFSAQPLTIHIPATIPAGDFPVIVVYDQATGTREVLTTTAWDANGVTAITNSLSGARILGTGSLRSNGLFAFLQDPGATVVVVATPPDILNADYDSGYRPGVDDWEFPITWTEITRTTGQVNTIGVPGTSLWYYATHPSPTRLNGRFLQQAGVPLSDRLGIRWTATLGFDYDVNAANAVIRALSARAADAAAFDANQAGTIRTSFAIATQDGGRARPVLVGGLSQDGVPVFLIVYRVTGNQFYVADPTSPGDLTRFLQFTPGNPMTPYVTGAIGGTTLSQPLALGLKSLIPLDRFAATYAQVLDGTIGQDRFPSYEFHGWDGRLYDTMFVVDTMRWWVECAQCNNGFATTLSPAPANQVASGILYLTGSTATLVGGMPTGGMRLSTTPSAGTDARLGLVVGSARNPQSTTDDINWLDWHQFVIRRLLTSITPAAPTAYVGVPLALTHQVTIALLPASVAYRWDFGDNTAKVTVQNNVKVNHTYTAVGTYPVIAEILDNRNSQVIGRSTTTVTVTVPQFAWQFTSVAQTGSQPPPGGIDPNDQTDQQILGFFNGWVNNLQTTPQNSEFFLYNDGSCQDLLLEMWPAGQFRPVIDSSGSVGKLIGIFGLTPPCDPSNDYVASLAMGTLGNGTLIGSAVDVPKTESLVLPGGSINATMTGTSLQGTFTWRVRFKNGEAVYSFNFTATQVLPAP